MFRSCAVFSLLILAVPFAHANKKVEDFDRSVTTGSSVTRDEIDFCSSFQKIKVPDASRIRAMCGESLASYVRFAEGWFTNATSSGEKIKGCRSISGRYTALENRQAELQNCEGSCERENVRFTGSSPAKTSLAKKPT